jgi:hypothetical protein
MRTMKSFLSAAALLLCLQLNAQKQWGAVGSPGFTPGICAYLSLAIDTSGTPYVSFLDATQGAKATVMKFNGSSWVTVGSAGFSANSITNNTALAFDHNDTLYCAYQESKASVKKFNGTNWVSVGNNGFSSGQAMYISIAFDNNNTPYVAYQDMPNGQKAVVMKYDGSGWIAVGSTGISAGQASDIALAIDGNTPYIAYRDAANNFKATVMKLTGSGWVPVGGVGFSAGSALYISLAFYNGTPYISYQDQSFSQKAVVMKFNGTNWVNVGSAPFSAGFVDNNLLAIDNNGTPYVAYKENGKATVMQYNGSHWVAVGNTGFSSGDYYYPSFAIDKNNIPHLAYMDWGTQRTTVMKHDCPAENKVSICAVLTDTVTDSNKIIWDGSTIPHVDSYFIYREESGSYKRIGAVAGSTNIFTDPTAETDSFSYQYKLTLLDSCGREMDIDSSAMHKTVRLAFNSIVNSDITIKWNRYEGISNLSYDIKRSNNGGAFTTLASFTITGSDTTYIDAGAPLGSNKYRVDMALANPCTAGSVSYNKITSNTITVQNVGINTVADRQILLVPNPADKELKLSIKETITKIEVFGITGKKLIAEKGNGKRESVVDVSALPPGTYLLRVNGIYNASFIKR